MSVCLPQLSDVTHITPCVTRVLGGNPGMYTLQGTNTYIVGTGKKRVLIDTGEGKDVFMENLRAAMQDTNCEKFKYVVLTHHHGDHVGGMWNVLNSTFVDSDTVFIKRPRTESGAVLSSIPFSVGEGRDWGLKSDTSSSELVGKWTYVDSKYVFEVEGATLTVLAAPGHTSDSLCLYLHEEDSMFSGDTILGHGTAVFEDLGAYMNSLKLLSDELSESLVNIYPAHGEMIANGGERLRYYYQHRIEREKQIIETIAACVEGALTISEIVAVIYKDYPKHLHLPAQGSVNSHLEKLLLENRVKEDDGKWSIS
eukprot:CFRG0384T1